MTPTLDYANTMLDIYLDDDDWQPAAISHYQELAQQERERQDCIDYLQEIVDDESSENKIKYWKSMLKALNDDYDDGIDVDSIILQVITEEIVKIDREKELKQLMNWSMTAQSDVMMTIWDNDEDAEYDEREG